jgi:hypothetical protein
VCHGCVTATSLQEQLVVLALERERVPSDSRTDESADLNEGFRRGLPVLGLAWWLGGVGLLRGVGQQRAVRLTAALI